MYFLCALVYPDANVICAMIWHHVLPNEVASVLRLVFKWLYLNPDKPDPFGSLLPIRRHSTIIPLANPTRSSSSRDRRACSDELDLCRVRFSDGIICFDSAENHTQTFFPSQFLRYVQARR